MEHIYFKKLDKISKIYWNISLWHDQAQEQEIWFPSIIFIVKNHLKKQNIGQGLFKKHSNFQNFDEIFCCSITRLRNTNLDVFLQFHHTKAILRSKNMGQSLFKKHPKFQNFNKRFYCGMNRLRSTCLGVFIQCWYTRTNLRNKNMGQSLFMKHSKFQNYNKIFYCCMIRLRNTYLNVST